VSCVQLSLKSSGLRKQALPSIDQLSNVSVVATQPLIRDSKLIEIGDFVTPIVTNLALADLTEVKRVNSQYWQVVDTQHVGSLKNKFFKSTKNGGYKVSATWGAEELILRKQVDMRFRYFRVDRILVVVTIKVGSKMNDMSSDLGNLFLRPFAKSDDTLPSSSHHVDDSMLTLAMPGTQQDDDDKHPDKVVKNVLLEQVKETQPCDIIAPASAQQSQDATSSRVPVSRSDAEDVVVAEASTRAPEDYSVSYYNKKCTRTEDTAPASAQAQDAIGHAQVPAGGDNAEVVVEPAATRAPQDNSVSYTNKKSKRKATKKSRSSCPNPFSCFLCLRAGQEIQKAKYSN